MPLIVGHRGACGYAPENTLLSFQTAIDLHCNRAELDVQLSKDGEIVVFHDEEISRLTDGHGLVHELTLAELKAVNCKENQKIPTLQEVIDLCQGKIDLQIELKAPGTPKLVNDLLLKNNFVEHSVITSFHPDLLQEIKNLNPSLKIGLLFKETPKNLWQLVKEIPLDFIAPQGNITTEEIVKKAHELSKTVYSFHVNDEETANKLIAMGVDEIGTDFPKMLLKQLRIGPKNSPIFPRQ